MTVDDFRRVAATHGIDLALATLSDHVVVRSPLTDRFTFEGKEDVGRLFETAYEKFEGLAYHTVIGEGTHRVLVGGATANGQPFEETLLLTLDDGGQDRRDHAVHPTVAGPDRGDGRTGPGTGPPRRPLPVDLRRTTRADRLRTRPRVGCTGSSRAAPG